MATMALAIAGAATIAAQEGGSQRSGQGQPQSGSTRGADQQQPTGQQTGMITVTGCVQDGGSAAGAGRTGGYTLMASAAGQRSGAGSSGAGAGSPGAGSSGAGAGSPGAGSPSTQRGGSTSTSSAGEQSSGGNRTGSTTGQNNAGASQSAQSGSADRAGSTGANQAMAYTLEGGDVAKHVGHQVEVTGTLAPSASAGGSTSGAAGSNTTGATAGNTSAGNDRDRSAVGTTGNTGRAQTLRVTSIRTLSETCNR